MNRERYGVACAALAKLCELYPRAFFIYGGKRQPLKIGIRNEIAVAGAVEPDELNLALAVYCRSFGYRNALRAGTVRLDLHGEPAGLVAAEHATPPEELQKWTAKWRARKKARKEQKAAQEAEAARLREETAAAAARPRRVGLADLKASAAARKQAEAVTSGKRVAHTIAHAMCPVAENGKSTM